MIDQLVASTDRSEAALEALEALARICWADEDARRVAASEAGRSRHMVMGLRSVLLQVCVMTHCIREHIAVMYSCWTSHCTPSQQPCSVMQVFLCYAAVSC